MTMELNLFYEEPDDDRWLPFDRFPRRVLRRALRGRPRPGGQARVYLNLRAGLERLGVPHRVNDYRHARRNPGELACVIGKPFVLDKIAWENPILFGAAVFSHPVDDPTLLERLPVRRVVVPGPWMREMWRPAWGDAVEAWPVGIDTERWAPSGSGEKSCDVLLYDKVRWEHQRYSGELLDPIRDFLAKEGRSFEEIRYGGYREEEFEAALERCRAMIFVCEHETQGIAYQQALACGVPVFAWDRGGYWQDPSYFPERVRFAPVTSVPYWDERCGSRFADFAEFCGSWSEFWRRCGSSQFDPRSYVLEHLTLEKCAAAYLEIAERTARDASARIPGKA